MSPSSQAEVMLGLDADILYTHPAFSAARVLRAGSRPSEMRAKASKQFVL
jgi:hypothetical protein